MRTALLFPGQGAPAASWRDLVAEHRPDLLATACELLGLDPFERFGEGTEFDQPAIYCASLAAFELAGRPAAAVHAGHSLGEISALACAGAFDGGDGLELVVERGALMAAAAASSGAGGMLAVGAPESELGELVARPDLAVANLNSPTQTVLSGADEAIEESLAALRESGIRAKRLAVSGAFHSAAMQPAADAFAGVLAGLAVAEPSVTVLSSRTGLPFEDVRAELAASLLEPVHWIDVVAALERRGIERCIEIGPGKALSVLVRRSAHGEIEATPLRLPEGAGA